MNFFGMFTISPEERLESALDLIFKDKEYKYLYFDFNNSLKIYIDDKVAVEIVYRTYMLKWTLGSRRISLMSMKWIIYQNMCINSLEKKRKEIRKDE